MPCSASEPLADASPPGVTAAEMPLGRTGMLPVRMAVSVPVTMTVWLIWVDFAVVLASTEVGSS